MRYHRCNKFMSGDDGCSMHELRHFNVLLLSVSCYVPYHDLSSSRVFRGDLVSSATKPVFPPLLHFVVR